MCRFEFKFSPIVISIDVSYLFKLYFNPIYPIFELELSIYRCLVTNKHLKNLQIFVAELFKV